MPRGPNQPPPKRPKVRRAPAEILADTRSTLETAEYGLADLLGHDARRKMPGLRNLVAFGRAVTNVLQNLSPVVPEFDGWYETKEAEMRSDELLAFFYKMRSEVLKQGRIDKVSFSAHIKNLNDKMMARLMSNPPPGAKSFFIGDNLGGSGWEVELPDGTTKRYYVALPDDVEAEVRLHFPEPPATHLGQPLADTSIEALASRYVDYLQDLVTEAEATFG